MRPCVYATSWWDGADDRWVAALIEAGVEPRVISVGRDVDDLLELREAILSVSMDRIVVVAGDVRTARALADLPVGTVAVVGTSEASALSADPEWARTLVAVLAESPVAAEAAHSAGMDPDRVIRAWGIDLDEFPFHGPWVDAFQLGVPPHAPLVVSLVPHEVERRLTDVVDAFARLERPPGLHEDFPDPYLIIGGSGSGTQELRLRCGDAGLTSRVRFIDEVAPTDLAPLLGRAACLVVPDGAPGLPPTLLAAMACGTPVVATATPDTDLWIDDRATGYLYPTGDVAALAVLMDELVHRHPIDLALRARRAVEAGADARDVALGLRAALR